MYISNLHHVRATTRSNDYQELAAGITLVLHTPSTTTTGSETRLRVRQRKNKTAVIIMSYIIL